MSLDNYSFSDTKLTIPSTYSFVTCNMMLSPGGIQVMIVGVVMNVFAIIAVGLRLWSRRIQGLSLEFNDYMAIIAVILTTGLVICCLFGKAPRNP